MPTLSSRPLPCLAWPASFAVLIFFLAAPLLIAAISLGALVAFVVACATVLPILASLLGLAVVGPIDGVVRALVGSSVALLT